MLDDKETVQQLKCQSRHSEEIEGYDDLPVVLEKRQPRFTWVAPASHATQIPGDSPLRDNEPELQQLAVDLRGSPIRVLSRAKRWIRVRISSMILGRPLRGRDRQHQ